MKNLTIPAEYRNGKIQYSECKMYSRNYTEALIFLHSVDMPDLIKYENYYIQNLQSTENEEYDIINCANGWTYDRTMFPNTVVMEVFHKLLNIIQLSSLNNIFELF